MRKILFWTVLAAGFVYMATTFFILVYMGNSFYGFTSAGVTPAAVITALRIDGYGIFPFTRGWR